MAETPCPWYLSVPFVLILFFVVGPFALPFLWLSPRFNIASKVILSVCVLFFSLGFFVSYSWLEQALNKQAPVLRELFPELAPYLPK